MTRSCAAARLLIAPVCPGPRCSTNTATWWRTREEALDLHAERNLSAEAVPHADPDHRRAVLGPLAGFSLLAGVLPGMMSIPAGTPRGHAAGQDED